MESEMKYDERFKSINGLKWLPWVGKNYDKTGVLIIAESLKRTDRTTPMRILPEKHL